MDGVKTEEQRDPMGECAAQLSSAAQVLERVIGKLEAQYEALNQKIDRIIATVEKQAEEKSSDAEVAASTEPVRQAKENRDLRLRMARRTLPATVSTLLAKSGVGEGAQMESSMLDRALAALTIEQRMAVKAELARAGMIA